MRKYAILPWTVTNSGSLRTKGAFSMILEVRSGGTIQEEANLPSRAVKAFSFTQDKRWFVTEKGVALFNETGQSLETL